MRKSWIALVAVLGLVGCQESVAAPEDAALDEMPAEVAGLYADGIPTADGRPARAGRPPLLAMLTGRAIRTVYQEQGEDAALALREEHRTLRLAVGEARRAGDEDAFRTAVDALTAWQAELVIEVLGTEPLDRILAGVASAIDRVNERIARAEAAGRDVPPRATDAIALATSLLAEAEAARDAGDDASALVLGARAADTLFRLHARGDRAQRAGHGGRGGPRG